MVPLISFMHPGRLWLALIAVAIGLLYVVLSQRLRAGGTKGRTRLDLVLPRDPALKRHLSVAAALLSVLSLVVAYAQPQDMTQVPRERATVVITIDVSRSMRAQDVSPSRIEAAQEAAKEFVDMLPTTFNVALVAFSGTASMVSPPTLDREAVKRAIDSLELAPATAVGEGIYTSLDALALAPADPDNPDEPAPGAIVLLSDGYTNIGRDSALAAQAAKDQNVPVYTIAYGTAGGYVYEQGVRVPVPVNHAELARVAQISGGKKYSAESLSDLKNIYQTLARSIGYEQVETEVTARYALLALVFGLLASMGVISLAARWP
ncbi:VWA domain-containing protein [Brooklawnia cerclae]|uniref:Ca-activated chloride channel family protein n=1 Tax=Brooklawnia cerclae TaxID=349934 RepID=A0ABX0SDW3_9ACTN|nr:VWA domain-containing protein [Brooklawnia cerclae]NIH56200.1 Ca-activated chloride channel family protein [Brooklawnia cerclae]